MKNPYSGETLFIHKKNTDVLTGTKGITVRNKYVAPIFKMTRGIIQAAKNAIIVGRPASYINSYVANTVSLQVHGGYLNPVQAQRDIIAAHRSVKRMRGEMDVIMRNFADPRKVEQGAKRLARLQKDPLFYALNDGGLQQSIRGSLSKVGILPRNELITTMKNNGVMNMSEDAAKAIETVMLQPNTKWGNTLGEAFDVTEIAPKVALHKRLMDHEKMTAKEAAIYVKMAYPDYNMNLPQVAALADEVMPFMKFFMSVPRMVTFTAQQRPIALAASIGLGQGMIVASNSMYDGDPYYADNGYVQLAPDVYKYVGSMSNYNIVPPGLANQSFMEGIFWPGNFNPLTIDYKE